MATETLGARILAAAGEHTRRWLDTDQGYDADIQESWSILDALCARADAAERLAVADAALMVARAARDENPDLDNWLTLDSAAEERRNARAAWRAITGEAQP